MTAGMRTNTGRLGFSDTATAPVIASTATLYIPISTTSGQTDNPTTATTADKTSKATKTLGTACRTDAACPCFFITNGFQYPYCRYCRNTSDRTAPGRDTARMPDDRHTRPP